jgi:hypothetical protein
MMSPRMQARNSWTNWLGESLAVLSLLFCGIVGCAQADTQPVDPAMPTPPPTPSPTLPIEATLPPGWETHNNGAGCGYAISYPPDMENGTVGWIYSWILRYFDLVLPPNGVAENYIYISVLRDDFQFKSGEIGIVFNYDPAEAETLLNIQVGESKALREDADVAQWLTYTRLPDTIINDRAAQTYESAQPQEFPRKEIRYYLLVEDCTYQIGGYLNTMNLDQPGVITKELFDQIIATFRLIA